MGSDADAGYFDFLIGNIQGKDKWSIKKHSNIQIEGPRKKHRVDCVYSWLKQVSVFASFDEKGWGRQI